VTGPGGAGVVVHVEHLVLVRRSGEPLAALRAPLGRQLEAGGVPAADADATAAAVLAALDEWVGP
jgi:hypothetical protein